MSNRERLTRTVVVLVGVLSSSAASADWEPAPAFPPAPDGRTHAVDVAL
jgi:hypothetical protein